MTSFEASLAVGIGCRRGVSADDIERAVRHALCAAFGFADMAFVACVASIDIKRDEAGLRAFCERHRLPVHFYGAHELAGVPVTPSAIVRERVNVDGVCEPCARLASGTHAEAALVAGKIIVGGVSVAIARMSDQKTA